MQGYGGRSSGLTHPPTLLKIPIGERGISAGPPEESRLRLSKRTEYGVRAIVQLARHWPRNFIHSQHLAQEEGLPNKFLESILLALRRGGFLDSKIGREGVTASPAPRARSASATSFGGLKAV